MNQTVVTLLFQYNIIYMYMVGMQCIRGKNTNY